MDSTTKRKSTSTSMCTKYIRHTEPNFLILTKLIKSTLYIHIMFVQNYPSIHLYRFFFSAIKTNKLMINWCGAIFLLLFRLLWLFLTASLLVWGWKCQPVIINAHSSKSPLKHMCRHTDVSFPCFIKLTFSVTDIEHTHGNDSQPNSIRPAAEFDCISFLRQ